MKCPVCNITLQMSERQGVEIDHCPQCRGVWLDRGELDKIIDRTYGAAEPTAPRRTPVPPVHPHSADDRYYKQKRKKNLLDELFDF